MKRQFALVLSTALLFGFAASAHADKASEIADTKAQIAALENETPAMLDRLGALKTEKENQITFVGDAYDKQKANYDQEVAAFNQKQDNVNRQYELLKPSLDNYSQRVNAHNANQCTEKCVNGSCDGSCAGYVAEKNQLDANKAQLEQAYAPVDAAAQQLQSQRDNLAQTHEKLETIRTGLNDEIESWKGKVAQLKAEWDEHSAKIAALEAKLAALYGSVNSCTQDIPVECDKPAIGPDGKPILDQNCEQMHAACAKMFDGNR